MSTSRIENPEWIYSPDLSYALLLAPPPLLLLSQDLVRTTTNNMFIHLQLEEMQCLQACKVIVVKLVVHVVKKTTVHEQEMTIMR